jgi:hypothetical protein
VNFPIRLSALCFAALAALSVAARAGTPLSAFEMMYTVKSVKVRETTRAPSKPAPAASPAPSAKTVAIGAGSAAAAASADDSSFNDKLDHAQVALDKIINMGREVWSVVEDGAPAANVSEYSGNALPEGATDWMSLESWQPEVARTYEVSYQNHFGMDVVDFKYRVVYAYGGSYAGRGRYLTGMTVIPEDLSVMYGYHFDAKVSIPTVTNAGTTEDPVAEAVLQLDWTIDTLIKHEQDSASFFIRGDGGYEAHGAE